MYSCCLFVCIVVSQCVLLLFGVCIVDGWECFFLLVGRVYCFQWSCELCWLAVCNVGWPCVLMLVVRVYCFWFGLFNVLVWPCVFCWLAVCIFVGWSCVLLLFGCV